MHPYQISTPLSLINTGLDSPFPRVSAWLQLYFLTRNLGLVTLMLGAMHMILLYVLANWKPDVQVTEEQ